MMIIMLLFLVFWPYAEGMLTIVNDLEYKCKLCLLQNGNCKQLVPKAVLSFSSSDSRFGGKDSAWRFSCGHFVDEMHKEDDDRAVFAHSYEILRGNFSIPSITSMSSYLLSKYVGNTDAYYHVGDNARPEDILSILHPKHPKSKLTAKTIDEQGNIVVEI